jgi:hypothetical protein
MSWTVIAAAPPGRAAFHVAKFGSILRWIVPTFPIQCRAVTGGIAACDARSGAELRAARGKTLAEMGFGACANSLMRALLRRRRLGLPPLSTGILAAGA